MAMQDEELLMRQLPHSVEAEQAVLGSMLIDPRCVPEVIDKLRVEDFYLRQNREIYETIYSMFNYSLTIDPVTVLKDIAAALIFIVIAAFLHVLQHRHRVDGEGVVEHGVNRLINFPVLAQIEILYPQLINDLRHTPGIDEHGTEHGLFGLNAVG